MGLTCAMTAKTRSADRSRAYSVAPTWSRAWSARRQERVRPAVAVRSDEFRPLAESAGGLGRGDLPEAIVDTFDFGRQGHARRHLRL